MKGRVIPRDQSSLLWWGQTCMGPLKTMLSKILINQMEDFTHVTLVFNSY